MLLFVTAFLAAALPWSLGVPPGEMLVWSLAVVPPPALLLLLARGERRAST